MNRFTPVVTTVLVALPALAGPPTAEQVMKEITPGYVRTVIDTLPTFGTRHSLSDQESPTRGIGAARAWIKREMESYGGGAAGGSKLEVSFEEWVQEPARRVPQPTRFVNVVAVLPGTMPEAAGRRYYVVGHYDSMPSDVMDPKTDAPGANDDGSGTTAVMAIARAMAATPCEATIVFLCTAGEEQGLLGAKHHAEQAAARGEHILGVLNNDIVGDPWGPGGDMRYVTKHEVRVFSEPYSTKATPEELQRIRMLGMESDSPSRQLARFVAEVAEWEGTRVQPMLVFRQDRFLRGGDHLAFNEHGFPAVRFTEVHEDYRHQHQTPREEPGEDGKPVKYGDLPEHVDAEYLANVARLNAAVLVHLANAPSPPGNARVVTARLGYDTTLRWEKSPEPDTAGYEVVWRETTSPTWQYAKDVEGAVEVTLPESKDNYFFGVRAYDKDGNKSPVAFALAARE
ncbi:MAG: M28 family metallopeptidase [Phycisphaerales bacterium]|nr:M28 family metallopeptidase [Phycisphaerales bacterium]